MAAEQIKEEEAKAEEAEAQDSENIPEEKPEPVKKTVRPKEQRQQQAVEEVVVPSAVKDTVPVELPAVDTMTVRETETLLPADVDTVSVQPVVKRYGCSGIVRHRFRCCHSCRTTEGTHVERDRRTPQARSR